jgi:hypothetical protein
MYVEEIEKEGEDWIRLPQDREQWRSLVNTVINPPFPQNGGNWFNS